jgi:membrane protein DedA with SNARE-associated domain
MTDLVLGWFAIYGLPVLFFALGASAFGIPMPVKLLMLAAGAIVEHGDMQFWEVLATGSLGAVAGDQVGFFLGRHGGRPIVEKITARYGGSKMLNEAERSLGRWGMIAVFLSRWLITPIGPWLNVICGSVGFSWTLFTVVGVTGEILWVLVYVLLGMYFSDRVEDTANLLISLTWLILGVAVLSYLGRKLFRYLTEDGNERSLETA